ncbi:DUF1697 domain-containing protein [Pseudoprimorskyibacter insulae]|uniref:DUF1697 domain-containing protein n=1 Tax=Pseudoprimorskyibacter insulae TaxID=1695997 RepID=A0A2R8AXA8_9RHOB|nr:DUF1697 domain-containing protein [Pseudoprimorskyibacter insulae]SPF80691.1 hypothetical protein PRI8871_02502 [Pseudoprimorskyibacter insulae]
MTQYAAFLRAVNVGGTGKLPMADLRQMCSDAGFDDPRTYITSGNVVFGSDLPEAEVKTTLEARLADYAGRPVPVFVRTAQDLNTLLNALPFADAEPSKVAVSLLDDEPTKADIAAPRHQTTESIALAPRAIVVQYPDGMGRSKLRLPAAEAGTARNVNTLRKVLAMLG